ncbi:hypothetical protein [Parvibaculum sp.]|uniref:hypothetical protein n=1 Tax=Parvibaculum sp. TaxID=2024848 RepID=UPI002C220802|nr:hypothetical protein [Parvibaculum sp.]HUD52860.1 hypothetical protein [Parvibaculum sp.]
MIDLLAKIVGALAQFGAAFLAFMLARESGAAKAMQKEVERQDAINDALANAPRDQSDAVGRLRDGTF